MRFLSTTPGGDQHDPKLISNTFPSFLTPSHQHLLCCCCTQTLIILYLNLELCIRRTLLSAVILCQSCSPLSSSSSSFAAFEGKTRVWLVDLSSLLSHLTCLMDLGPHFTRFVTFCIVLATSARTL